MSYAEFAQADPSPTEEEDLWAVLPLDLQRAITALLCYNPRTVGADGAPWVQDESVPALTSLHNNVRAMRIVSHAHRHYRNWLPGHSCSRRVHDQGL